MIQAGKGPSGGARRRVPRLVACVIGGALVSVVVAWSTVYFAEFRGTGDPVPELWGQPPANAWPRNADALLRESHVGLTVLRAFWTREEGMLTVSWEYTAQFVGFPFECLWSVWTPCIEVPAAPTSPARLQQPVFERGIRIPRRQGPTAFTTGHNDRFLPLMPLWAGLLADTLLYGGVLYALVAGAGWFRRRRRRRKGLCPWCGHVLRGQTRCPECGGA